MSHKIQKMFIIIFIIFSIVTILASIGVNVVAHSNSKGAYYLYRSFAWAKSIKVTENMNKQKLDDGILYSNRKLENEDAQLVEELIMKGENSTKNILEQFNHYPLRIVIFSTSKEYEEILKDSSSEASYDSYALYLSFNKLSNYSFIHEYTHYKMESFCKENKINAFSIPTWFKEGLAEYISFPHRKNKPDKLVERIKNFSELNNQKEFTNARLAGYDVYYQSYLAIKKIIELKGEKSIKNIILDLNKMDFDNAFKKNTDLSVEEIQKLIK